MAAFDFLVDCNVADDFRGCSFLNMLSETSPEKELAYLIYSLFENAIIESKLHRDLEPVYQLKK